MKSYAAKYGTKPNSYAIRGYDITYDLLLRLSSKDDMSNIASSPYITEYVENKFSYVKNTDGGYTNQACYIMCYKPGLEINLVE